MSTEVGKRTNSAIRGGEDPTSGEQRINILFAPHFNQEGSMEERPHVEQHGYRIYTRNGICGHEDAK